MSGSAHSIVNGTTGIGLAYLVVLLPMVTALIRGRAHLGILLLSPVLALPVMLAAALFIALIDPVLKALGLAPDGLLITTFGVAVCAIFGYGVGRYLTSFTSSPDPTH